ncbi:hypothetical protein CV093_01145 [Oceanobacillus sp. 143]|uniref:Uncharacterized protein n=1 Tax=Oceanobacillus zhaokaii TaxID=2052660 RepID=A0A345PCE5_9BACI|nr:hypothetical protein [Oceanobacillus zhaokaii]AXI07675.1 hypothetical protein CUC15_01110 [Oceanobacillus zhaokaii]QGS67855.1 hypothetical protein CV093_01145 [Oceanobacillus sp. 143]
MGRIITMILRYAAVAINWIWRNIKNVAAALVSAIRAGYTALSNFCQKYAWACIAVYNWLDRTFF